ncbi:unnamed protein product [Callosobruchus maculatus]|uniref:Uncharacterized protein n=1 Tax=Callosobruchus maculatus TaxID=64391 RepID=A0A653D067_CALMS|nr:unnamed protein product [Callosobruchus maculatus]
MTALEVIKTWILILTSKASFSEQRSVASDTSVTSSMSRIDFPYSFTTVSPATACVVGYFQLHYPSKNRNVIKLSSVVAGDTFQISQHGREKSGEV